MKVLFDYKIFTWQKFGGISRYFVELFKHFSADVEVIAPMLISNNEYIKDLNFPYVDLSSLNFSGKTRISDFANKIHSKFIFRSCKFDLFHPTYYDSYFLKQIKGQPFVLTVHDMIHELYPNMFDPKDRTHLVKRELINKASAIIAVSENTKNDILKITGISSSKITVIYHGYNINSELTTSLPTPFHSNYILYVGERSGYKNFCTFLKAFAHFVKEVKDIKLICVGKPFNANEMSLLRAYLIDKDVLSFGASDQELANLYRNALFFVYPSIYEGFGIPILEAFSNGCPVIASNNSCFPEIALSAALYFDPYDEYDIKNCMITVYANKQLRDIMIQNGFERLKFFCWEKAALNTEAVYKQLI